MRPIVGTTGLLLERRGLGIERFVVLGMGRDEFAETPGQGLTLYLGEHTSYRPAAFVLDPFDRADGALGASYTAVLSGGLVLSGGHAVPAALSGADADRVSTFSALDMPRDQWAAATIRALTSPAGYASVGLALRWDASNNGYLAIVYRWPPGGGGSDTLTHAGIVRFDAGAPTNLVDVVSPWAVGDVLGFTADYATLTITRNGVPVHTATDSTYLAAGAIGLEAWTEVSGDLAALGDFHGGPLRQEYVGLIADVGDVTASLGLLEPTAQPHAWSVAVINCAPIAGAERFAKLLRHGLNAGPGTYDIYRQPVRVIHAISGGSGSLQIAEGRVVQPDSMTELSVSLPCRGRDAFARLKLKAGRVAYLAGVDPLLLPSAPIPDDPCGADAVPSVIPGGTPTEPPGPPPLEPPGVVGGGPEAPPAESGIPPLNGAYLITLDYTLHLGAGDMGEDIYEGSTTVQKIPDDFSDTWFGYHPTTRFDFVQIRVMRKTGIGEAPLKPERIQETWYYRGPDCPGSGIVNPPTAAMFDGTQAVKILPTSNRGSTGHGDTLNFIPFTLKLAEYSSAGIHNVSDLGALRPKQPDGTHDPLPARIRTLHEWSAVWRDYYYTCTPHTPDMSDSTLWHEYRHRKGEILGTGPITLGAFTGPQLIRLEMPDWGGVAADEVGAVIGSYYFQTPNSVGFTSSPTFCNPATSGTRQEWEWDWSGMWCSLGGA